MVETINLLLIQKFGRSLAGDGSEEYIDRWLTNAHNYKRLQRECDKIWLHQFNDERYDVERAFSVLGQRLIGICRHEI